jgi:hypothetical protein
MPWNTKSKEPGIEMDEQTVFAFLKSARRPVLKYLESAYRSMNDRQRRKVFAGAVPKPRKEPRIDAVRLLRDVRHSHSDSIAQPDPRNIRRGAAPRAHRRILAAAIRRCDGFRYARGGSIFPSRCADL